MNWILVDKQVPEEKETIFAKGTRLDLRTLPRTLKESDRVLVTAEFEDGSRVIEAAYTADGEWRTGHHFEEVKVIAWMPFPKPYREE